MTTQEIGNSGDGDQEGERTFHYMLFKKYPLEGNILPMCMHCLFKSLNNWKTKIDEQSSIQRVFKC